MPDDEQQSTDHEERLQKLERFQELMERLEIQANGSNAAIVFTKDNAVIRIGVQT